MEATGSGYRTRAPTCDNMLVAQLPAGTTNEFSRRGARNSGPQTTGEPLHLQSNYEAPGAVARATRPDGQQVAPGDRRRLVVMQLGLHFAAAGCAAPPGSLAALGVSVFSFPPPFLLGLQDSELRWCCLRF